MTICDIRFLFKTHSDFNRFPLSVAHYKTFEHMCFIGNWNQIMHDMSLEDIHVFLATYGLVHETVHQVVMKVCGYGEEGAKISNKLDNLKHRRVMTVEIIHNGPQLMIEPE